ncbi:SDR family NAD(P)-dependent oxidoreductase [Labedaea rhizosphaerae]|uniref:NADP-dependent 3-hydroxy acid dehydrogenase YdfG n=1 Tax=Labedaea rhizosphaerae TaxID=598644 RepID=A0A4R6SDG0_LABRH|nr:SDR family NAD(P)-dependent oxidoreductase [Labedaea rhizosphaerae]TDP97902.1 NADP-dependent 3-hydroxy acid dehydrogenase YdfG [Labedaea rhizosphaerae]
MGKVWFVTGSSRGLGRSIVTAALEAGNRVAASARNPRTLDDLVAKYGEQIHPIALDVADQAAAEQAIKAAAEHFGRLDVVVNNAGYADVAAIEDVELDAFRRQIETNFYGTVHVTKAAVPVLRAQGGGHIVQITSIGGRVGTPGLAAYQSAKWAVEGFSEVLAKEVAPFGIKVTLVEPGGIRTDWAGSSMTIPPISEPYRQTVGAMVEMREDFPSSAPIDPDKAADAIVRITGVEEPPLRLLLGRQATALAAATARARDEDDARWRELSESVEFDDVPA